jgi:TPR repeat protein
VTGDPWRAAGWRAVMAVAVAGGCTASCSAFTHTRAELGPGCASGDADDCLSLGYMLLKGQDGRPDSPGALRRFERSCALGNSIGCSKAAEIWESGAVGPADPAKAAVYRDLSREIDARAHGRR